MFWILLLVFAFCASVSGQDLNKMLLVDEQGKAILRTFATCEYKLVLKKPQGKEVKISVNQMGNSWFAGEHRDKFDYIITVNHLLECDSTVVELQESGILDGYDKNSDEDLSVTNIVGLKDSHLRSISAYTFDGAPVRDIKILFNEPVSNDGSDKALLQGILDEGVFHSHFHVMDDKVFDEIFYKDGIGKFVVARGFLMVDGRWRFRHRTLEIESLWPEVFQAGGRLSQGLSGGPVAFFYENIYYGIGAVASSEKNVPDMLYISIIKKSFLEKRNKK